jgi:hypothetical protein
LTQVVGYWLLLPVSSSDLLSALCLRVPNVCFARVSVLATLLVQALDEHAQLLCERKPNWPQSYEEAGLVSTAIHYNVTYQKFRPRAPPSLSNTRALASGCTHRGVSHPHIRLHTRGSEFGYAHHARVLHTCGAMIGSLPHQETSSKLA